jgi:hypothetical protein
MSMSAADEVPTFRSAFCLLVLCLASLAVASCSGGSGENNQNNEDDGPCQYDCFADYRCQDGTVFEKQGGPIPCSEYSSQQEAADICANRPESEFKTCAEGCRTDVENVDQYPSYTPDLCAEDRLVQPGDPCNDTSDCSPTDAGVGPLECEQSSGTCIDPDAPEDAGMSDAGDAGTEDVADDTQDEDIADDTSTQDAQTEDAVEDTQTEDTQTDDTQTDDTQSDDATDSSTSDTDDTQSDDATDT